MKPRVAAILVARQGSVRLPGKSMAEIMGQSVVGHIIERLQRMDLFDEVVLATSTLPQDGVLVAVAEEKGAKAFVGEPEDVLKRLSDAARSVAADVVVEVGGDCPFVDKGVVQKGLDIFFRDGADYVTNVDPQTYPDGIDVHIVRMNALEEANQNAILSSQRNHPFGYFHKHQDRFKCLNYGNSTNLSKLRWTLDYVEDYELVKSVYERLYPVNPLFSMDDILKLLEKEPKLRDVNKTRIIDSAVGEVPGYWYTKAYIKDMLTDVKVLSDKLSELEDMNAYQEMPRYLKEMYEINRELSERARYLGKNN